MTAPVILSGGLPPDHPWKAEIEQELRSSLEAVPGGPWEVDIRRTDSPVAEGLVEADLANWDVIVKGPGRMIVGSLERLIHVLPSHLASEV